MIKKLIRLNHSSALLINKPLLEILEIEEGGFVKLKTNGKSLTITPVDRQELNEALQNLIEKGVVAADHKYINSIKEDEGAA